MNKVYEKVFEIEKYKENVNYEGAVREIASSGSFEIEGISSIAASEGNPFNHLLVGDYYGNIFLLDMNKKVQINKFSVSDRRVIHIAANTIKDEEYITTICVICRADPNIHVFRYKSGENKIFKNFTVSLMKKTDIIDKNTSLNLFPYSCKISNESKFLAAIFYTGNIEIFTLPEPQFSVQTILSEMKSSSKIPIRLGEASQKQPTPIINLDISLSEINEIYYSIPVKLPLKKKTYEETLNKFLQSIEKKTPDESLDPKLSKEKKPAPVDTKKQKIEEVPVVNSEYETNEIQNIGEVKRNDKEADISANYKLPEYSTDIFFITEKIYLPHDIKTFCKVKEFPITTKVAVVSKKQNGVDIYQIQNPSKENFPNLLKQKLKTANITETQSAVLQITKKEPQQIVPQSANKLDTKKPGNLNAKPTDIKAENPEQTISNEKKLCLSFDVIYSINCAAVNKSQTFLALGLIDGSVFVYDLLLSQEHGYFDKHTGEVTYIRFLEDWKVISGSSDGVIHVYDIKENLLTMKRTNIFKPSNLSIEGLEISEAGLAVTIDNQYNARVYDIIHHEKIMRLQPIAIMEENKKQWCLWPNSIICAQKGFDIYSIFKFIL